MKYTYLLINFLTVVFPVALSFDKRVQFYKSWRYIWPGMLLTGLVFLFWDVLFVLKNVWSFNPDRIIGLNIFHLPLEEVLFFLTVPFACIFIYACLNYYVRWQLPQRFSEGVSNLLIGFSAALVFFYHARLYTVATFSLLLVLLIVLQYIIKSNWLPRFYMAFIVSLAPFYIVNGILTAIPVVLYNNAQNMGIRVGTIPFEDHFYSMALLLMNVGLFEYFRSKANPA